MHEELLKHYKVVRGMTAFVPSYTSAEMRRGFVDVPCVDTYSYEQHIKNVDFYQHIDLILTTAKNTKTHTLIGSHAITADGRRSSGEAWAITPERLEYILKKTRELGLRFYTYKDLQ
jgi:hypothetical protein